LEGGGMKNDLELEDSHFVGQDAARSMKEEDDGIQSIIPQTPEDIELLRIAMDWDYGMNEIQPPRPGSDISSYCKLFISIFTFIYIFFVYSFELNIISIFNWIFIPLIFIFGAIVTSFKSDVFIFELVLPHKKKYIMKVKNITTYKYYMRMGSIVIHGFILIFVINMTEILLSFL
jgi:hypothetical protein